MSDQKEIADADTLSKEVSEDLVSSDAIDEDEKGNFQEYVKSSELDPKEEANKVSLLDHTRNATESILDMLSRSAYGTITDVVPVTDENYDDLISDEDIDLYTLSEDDLVLVISDNQGNTVKQVIDTNTQAFANLISYTNSENAHDLEGSLIEEKLYEDDEYRYPTNTALYAQVAAEIRGSIKSVVKKTKFSTATNILLGTVLFVYIMFMPMLFASWSELPSVLQSVSYVVLGASAILIGRLFLVIAAALLENESAA